MRLHDNAKSAIRAPAFGPDRSGGQGAAGDRLASLSGLVREVVDSPGAPLDPEVRTSFGAKLGHSFEDVRIHTDARAATSARLLGARAYTVGKHVAFADGRFQPGSPEGDRLIAHELVHVLQQDGSTPGETPEIVVAESGGHFDREASAIADRVVSGTESEVLPQPVVATKLHRTEALVVQRSLLGGLIGGGIGGALGGLVGFAIGGPVGAVVGAVAGGFLGAVIGASISPFPTYPQIVGDADVQAKVNAAWTSTKAATTAASRREEGFWIRLNKGTGKYEFTATALGPVVGPTVGGSVVLGSRPADVNSGTGSAIYTVASFHTHTPTAFRPVGRPVGPSAADNSADTSDDVVGVVYDYVASPSGSGAIPAGHPLNSTARLWHSGPDRRQRM
jgi:outer membrane lipoprotein SlyB